MEREEEKGIKKKGSRKRGERKVKFK